MKKTVEPRPEELEPHEPSEAFKARYARIERNAKPTILALWRDPSAQHRATIVQMEWLSWHFKTELEQAAAYEAMVWTNEHNGSDESLAAAVQKTINKWLAEH